MWYRLSHLTPVLRVALIAVSALGLLGLGFVLATGALRGEAAGQTEDAPGEPDVADTPPMDRDVPDRVETATFAMG